MKKIKSRKLFEKIIFIILGLVLVILVWEIISFATNALFLPHFYQCFVNLFKLLGSSITWKSIGLSLLRVLISFSISAVVGIFLGQIAGRFSKLEYTLTPLMTVLKALPTVAIVLLLVAFTKHSYLYVVSILLFPLIYQSSKEGCSEVYRQYRYDLIMEGKNNFIYNMFKVSLPLSMDYILLSLIQSFGLGIKAQIMAETFSYSSTFNGIGKLIYSGYLNSDYLNMMSYVLIALFITLIFDIGLIIVRNKIEKKLNISKENN